MYASARVHMYTLQYFINTFNKSRHYLHFYIYTSIFFAFTSTENLKYSIKIYIILTRYNNL